jgi:hypothetical protein
MLGVPWAIPRARLRVKVGQAHDAPRHGHGLCYARPGLRWALRAGLAYGKMAPGQGLGPAQGSRRTASWARPVVRSLARRLLRDPGP